MIARLRGILRAALGPPPAPTQPGPTYTRIPHFVTVGAHTYFGVDVRFTRWIENDSERIEIGKYCSIASRVHFVVGGNRQTHHPSLYPFDNKVLGRKNPTRSYLQTGVTRVGNDVLIHDDAYIGGGVSVGHGCVIGARTVVAKDIPPFAVVVGSPPRIIRYRFDPATIERILRVAWWDWPEAKINENAELFYLPIGEFLARFDP
jgi:acetyltransferase-like isoleucine patch superfamily enzyme